MKAKTFLSNNGVIVVFENEHKEVFVIVREAMMDFASFDIALHWANKEVFNGSSYINRTS